MIEQQLRDGLQAAVTKEPPLGFDPDELVDDARRTAHRRRTALAAAAAAAIVAAGTIGAVAATGGLGSGTPQRLTPGTTVQRESLSQASQRLGDSLVEVLPDVLPQVHDFEVKIAAEKHGKVAGIVFFQDGSSPAAVGFLATAASQCKGCTIDDVTEFEHTSGGMSAFGVSKVVRGVELFVGTAKNVEAIDSSLGPMFTTDHPCSCDVELLQRIPDEDLGELVTDPRIAVPDRDVVDPQGELTPEEIKRQKEEREQAEAAAEAAKRAAELEAKQEKLERELQKQKSAEESSGGK